MSNYLDKTGLSYFWSKVKALIETHISNQNNPHNVTASQVGADPTGTSQNLQNNLINGSVIPLKVCQVGRQVMVDTSSVWTSQTTSSGTAYWDQTISVPDITTLTEVSICLDADGINQLLSDGVTAFWAENENGVCKLKVLGAAPKVAMTLCLILSEMAGS